MSKADGRIPTSGAGKRGEEGHVGYLLRQAANVFRNKGDQALFDLHLTIPQFSVMTMLSAYPGLSNADLARLAMLTPQTVNVIVNNLEKAGLIARSPHAHHGRIRQLELTDKGGGALIEAKRRIYALEEQLLTGLSADEAAIIRLWLGSVSRETA